MSTEINNDLSTAKEKAAALRKIYREKGWNARQISVRSESFSMGEAVNVSVKGAEVDFEEAERLAKQTCESVRRCEMTGDILSGGNCYVSVSDRREQ